MAPVNKLLWRMGTVWVLGLCLVGYVALPSGEYVEELGHPASHHEDIAVPVPPLPCWRSLADSIEQSTKASAPLSTVRGSLISHGHYFAIQQDQSGHLYRQPLSASNEDHDNKQVGLLKDQPLFKTGILHDTAPQQGVAGSITDIQRCDSNAGANTGDNRNN